MAQDPLGVVIVGAGMISEFQSDAIRQVPGLELLGYVDRVRDLAEKRAEQFGVKAYRDLEEALADSRTGLVSVCTPSGSHLEPALAAAKARKHVMVEKPVEVTTERVDEIIRACRENRVRLGAIFPRRFFESSRLLKQTIESGRFGVLTLGDVYIKWYRSQEYYDRGGWRGTWKLDGGGALMNQGIHGIDLIQWLLGGVESVGAHMATLAHERIEVEDVATATVRYRCGALGVIEGTTAAFPGAKIRIEISGSKGTVVMEDETILHWEFEDSRPEDEDIRRRFGPREGLSGGGASDPKAISSEGHRRQFADFAEALAEGRDPFCDGVEGRAPVAIITGIYRAAREGRIVRVE